MCEKIAVWQISLLPSEVVVKGLNVNFSCHVFFVIFFILLLFSFGWALRKISVFKLMAANSH